MGHVIKFAVSILFVVVVAAFYALLNIDLNEYKGRIEQAASDATGRELKLEGDVSLAWSLTPILVVEKATLSNAKWGSAAQMVSFGKFELHLALYPLLKRDIQVTKVFLKSPKILIETNKKGVGNWVFDRPSQAKQEDDVENSGSGSLIDSVILNDLDIEQAEIQYIDGVTGEKKKILINNLSVDIADFEQPIDIALKAILDDIPLALNGKLGGMKALIDNSQSLVDLKLTAGGLDVVLNGKVAKPHQGRGAKLSLALKTTDSALSALSATELPKFGSLSLIGDVSSDLVSDTLTLDLSAALEGLNLLLKGIIVKPAQGKGLALNVDLQTNSSILALLSGSELPPIGDISLKGDISNGLKSQAINLDLAAVADGLDLAVKGQIAEPKKGDSIALDVNLKTNTSTLSKISESELPALGEIIFSGALSSQGRVYELKALDLKAGKTDLKGQIRVSLEAEKPNITATLTSDKVDLTVFEQQSAAPKPKSKHLFSDEPLVFDALKQLDANLMLKVEQLDSKSARFNKVDLGIDLQKGHLRIKPFDADFAGSQLAGNIDLNTQNDNAVLETKMQINGFKLDRIKALKQAITGGNTDVYFQAKAEGKSVSQMMAGLNGKALVKVGESQVEDGTLDLLGADFVTELFAMLNPFSKEKKGTELACVVVNFDIKDGIATAKKGIAVQTGRLNIVGDGTINLKNEKIKINIKPEARTGLGINISQLAGLVKIGGTLANPAAKIDQTAVLAAGVSGAAAVATGGLSIVAQGLANRGTADADPCKTALGAS